jgi:protein transport protein SEC24
LYYFPNFEIQKDGDKFYYQLFRNISRVNGSDVMIKARCSKGMSVTEYFGGFGLRE